MGNKDYGASLLSHLLHFIQAFTLKRYVTNGQHFINNKYFRFEVGRHGESQAHVHPAGIMLDRRVYEVFNLGERDNLIELPVYFAASHTEDRAVQVDVLAPAQLRVETCADFEQAADAAVNVYPAGRRLCNARKNFEQSGFARAVAPDDTNDFARLHFKADIFQRPDRAVFSITISPKPAERGAQRFGDRIA